jgi:hypothetical protein
MGGDPDSHGRLEHSAAADEISRPVGPSGDRHALAQTRGIRDIAFAVDDIDAVVASLRDPRPGSLERPRA